MRCGMPRDDRGASQLDADIPGAWEVHWLRGVVGPPTDGSRTVDLNEVAIQLPGPSGSDDVVWVSYGNHGKRR